MKIMVAYDGTLQSKEALAYGMQKVRENGGEIVALHVFNSPLFMDYDASPDARTRAEAESARFVEEAKTVIREKGAGVNASLFSTEGDPEDAVISFARQEQVDVLLCPPAFKGIISKYRKTLAASELASGAAKLDIAAVAVPSR